MYPRFPSLCRFAWVASLIGILTGLRVAAGTLDSGPVRMVVEPEQGIGVALTQRASVQFHLRRPLCLQLLTGSGTTLWLSNAYSSVIESAHGLDCTGSVRSPNGSIFEFSDRIESGPQAGTVRLRRVVNVAKAAAGDAGFLSRFSLAPETPHPLHGFDVFIPGIWYLDNRHVPGMALAGDLSEEDFLCREDRLPLPMVMLRDKHRGTTLTLIHASPDGSTCLADYSGDRVVDADIQVASLGVSGQDNAAAVFCYPGSEGERSYLRPRNRRHGWVERFHPVQPGVRHGYELLIGLSEQSSFPPAMSQAWRLAYESIHPPASEVDIAASYEASIQLISHWSKVTRGAPGVPFRLRLPGGELEDQEKINYQMGFVGQQLPLAYHLLRYGLTHSNETILRQGEITVDFWAANAPTAEGLPRTWYNTWPEPHWRRYNTFLRVASDGMSGALMAYDVMAGAGRMRPEWLAFCRVYGDWLVAHQNEDGSWYREYRLDSTPAARLKENTCHPIRFLVDLSKATGRRTYLDAALRAGDWCWTNTHAAFCYVGGTVDNPNVIDKEAGFLALDAFLALRDATGQERWLQAALQAADFTETWAYCWNVPIPEGDALATYPRGATTTGFSLIACGHSGADLFLAGAPFHFYRLYLQTGDAHYAEFATQLLHDTRQGLDLDGTRGYGFPGLCTEALSLAPPRGRGVNTWLPWLSYSMMEPVVRLEEAYGAAQTPLLDAAQRLQWRARDQAYGRTRGLHVVVEPTRSN